MSLTRTLAVMRNNPFLVVLGEDGRRLLAFDSDPINLKPRESLFDAGDPADGAILVLGGQLRLIPEAASLKPRVYSVGQLVDEMALIVPKERGATAIAQTSCEVFPLDRARMLRVLNEYPQAARGLQRIIAKRAQSFVSDIG
ncbi:MAG: Crp/Fnr family transcriptional regulator, partial [Pseudomonadota bacterium]